MFVKLTMADWAVGMMSGFAIGMNIGIWRNITLIEKATEAFKRLMETNQKLIKEVQIRDVRILELEEKITILNKIQIVSVTTVGVFGLYIAYRIRKEARIRNVRDNEMHHQKIV